jgi:hypothetical protein
LVFVLQMEESKQKMWMRWGKIALLREGESPVLPGEGREEKRGLLVGRFYTILNLEVGRQYVINLAPSPLG